MIIRFFRAVIRDGEQEAFKSFFFRTALPFVRSQKGLESVTIGLPHASTPNEFSMLTVWRDLSALKEFAGENWREAVIHPDEAHLLKETHVHHYELAETLVGGKACV
jgi:heme-degrading monooxygenase HmoA